ncbi:hypothetical protein ACFQ3Z_44445 [Streptomyces nogalater]
MALPEHEDAFEQEVRTRFEVSDMCGPYPRSVDADRAPPCPQGSFGTVRPEAPSRKSLLSDGMVRGGGASRCCSTGTEGLLAQHCENAD